MPGGQKYIIALSKTRSITALIACIIITLLSVYAIAGGMVLYAMDDLPAALIFQWFTTVSNAITCLSAFMIIPFAVEGIRKKHFAFPNWISVFLYSGMVCTTLTMVCTIFFISWVDPELAFGGYNLYLHFVCPIAVIIAFFMVESGYLYTKADAFRAVIPIVIYLVVYLLEVVIIGEDNGGWVDLYHIQENVSVWVSLICFPLIALGVAFLIRFLSNKITLKRRKRLLDNLWPEDVKPAKINVEVFGLGRYMGKHSDPECADLYLDLICSIAKQYNMKPEDLIRPYIKGYVDSLEEKNQQK